MRKMMIALFSAALVAGGMSYRAHAADAEKKTVEGELVDTHCYSAGERAETRSGRQGRWCQTD